MCSSTPTFPPKNLGCSSLFDAVHILRAIFIHAKNHVEEIEKWTQNVWKIIMLWNYYIFFCIICKMFDTGINVFTRKNTHPQMKLVINTILVEDWHTYFISFPKIISFLVALWHDKDFDVFSSFEIYIFCVTSLVLHLLCNTFEGGIKADDDQLNRKSPPTVRIFVSRSFFFLLIQIIIFDILFHHLYGLK